MEPICSSETTVGFYRTTEDRTHGSMFENADRKMQKLRAGLLLLRIANVRLK
jgi:uncharacterized membrane protein affecting hemolysin expression